MNYGLRTNVEVKYLGRGALFQHFWRNCAKVTVMLLKEPPFRAAIAFLPYAKQNVDRFGRKMTPNLEGCEESDLA
jgi:hypothetical protein